MGTFATKVWRFCCCHIFPHRLNNSESEDAKKLLALKQQFFDDVRVVAQPTRSTLPTNSAVRKWLAYIVMVIAVVWIADMVMTMRMAENSVLDVVYGAMTQSIKAFN